MARRKEEDAVRQAYDGPLRTASGERGAYQEGHCFAMFQGELWKAEGRIASVHSQLAVVELNNGKWMNSETGLFVYDRQYDTREQALRTGVAAIVRTMRMLARPHGEWSAILRGEAANAVIAWALSVAGRTPPAPTKAQPPSRPDIVRCPFPVGARVRVTGGNRIEPGRTGTVMRHCSDVFPELCYVTLDLRPRERTQKREQVAWADLALDEDAPRRDPVIQLSLFDRPEA